MSASRLFEPATLGGLTLRNHVVMAPMTRSRAIGNLPNDLMATYYAQRASAGLIISEGVAPSPNGLGYARIPGLFTAEQATAWRRVTDAVHVAGGRIFVQLMHTGRIGHPLNLPAGAELVAPSAVRAAGEMWTDQQGPQPHPTPRALTTAELADVREEFVRSARLAVNEAGFDGIELHGANGYLLEQFLHPDTNQRTDGYGGSVANRARFVLEVVDAVSAAIGADRVGIRLSPYGVFNDLTLHPAIDETYLLLADELQARGIGYVHLIDQSAMGAVPVSAALVANIRARFRGTLILNGGYDRARAEADLASGRADLVAFGRPLLANPDFVARLQADAPLNEIDFSTFYTPGEQGYTDYPTLAEATVVAA